ncbi:mediator of RNA polymerase II transcription subunit 28 isoform X1 [Sus scrofa]|uniref:mediator of RNA polymerase II transcription subunit 28 isoform X1 n=1 Tax=Sus scrofa TaxID=9823 RepID=UPI000A2B450F|nr:mediator of RNA polymerase II transcription subunit 28 isoform X1 [Sus scrofa]
MAAPLGGMFTGQPPGPPPPPPGLLGQASLLQATPGIPRTSNSTLVDELESSFEACFASLVSQDYVNGTDQEEIRTGCLRTKERVTAEGCSGPEALDQTEALAAGTGGHQCTAQETGRPPPGLSGLPGAGVCQHPCTHETKLRPGQPGSALADKSAQMVCQTSLFIDMTFGRTLCQRMR